MKGSIKLSLRIGEYLEENYDLTDHRGDRSTILGNAVWRNGKAAYGQMANMIRNETEENNDETKRS